MSTERAAATRHDLAAVVMAAGLGTRMRSATAKHFHPLLGRRMVDWAIAAVAGLEPARIVVVTSPGARDEFEGVEVAVQETPRGTGDAAAAARALLGDWEGDVLVVSGDAPLLTTELLAELVDAHAEAGTPATILSFVPEDSLDYGRVIRGDGNRVLRVVEAGDASPEVLAIPELNASVYVFRAGELWPALERLRPENVKGELYLTDAVGHLVEAGEEVAVHRTDDAVSVVGVNTRVELASAARVLRDRINERHMLAGVTIVDPGTTWIEPDVELAEDVVVEPFTVLRGRTRAARGAQIGPHVVATDAAIGEDATVGPFCYLRPGTVLEAAAKAGTFVEIKNSRVGEGTKVPHLSYVGDAEIGDGTNVGAGAITANLEISGKAKHRTRIGRNVKTGVHNAFVAPVEIGDDSWTAAGSVITDDVPPGSLVGFPPRQETRDGYVYAKERDGRDGD